MSPWWSVERLIATWTPLFARAEACSVFATFAWRAGFNSLDSGRTPDNEQELMLCALECPILLTDEKKQTREWTKQGFTSEQFQILLIYDYV
jgi:hypothetical protein